MRSQILLGQIDSTTKVCLALCQAFPPMPQLRSSFATAYAHSAVCGFVASGTTTVTDFLYNFLKSKYGVPSAIAEAGYNLVDALQRYQVRVQTMTGGWNHMMDLCLLYFICCVD